MSYLMSRNLVCCATSQVHVLVSSYVLCLRSISHFFISQRESFSFCGCQLLLVLFITFFKSRIDSVVSVVYVHLVTTRWNFFLLILSIFYCFFITCYLFQSALSHLKPLGFCFLPYSLSGYYFLCCLQSMSIECLSLLLQSHVPAFRSIINLKVLESSSTGNDDEQLLPGAAAAVAAAAAAPEGRSCQQSCLCSRQEQAEHSAHRVINTYMQRCTLTAMSSSLKFELFAGLFWLQALYVRMCLRRRGGYMCVNFSLFYFIIQTTRTNLNSMMSTK